MDEADRTEERAEIERQAAVAASVKPTGPQPIGECHACEAPLAKPLRWCGVECRDDWELKQRMGGR